MNIIIVVQLTNFNEQKIQVLLTSIPYLTKNENNVENFENNVDDLLISNRHHYLYCITQFPRNLNDRNHH